MSKIVVLLWQQIFSYGKSTVSFSFCNIGYTRTLQFQSNSLQQNFLIFSKLTRCKGSMCTILGSWYWRAIQIAALNMYSGESSLFDILLTFFSMCFSGVWLSCIALHLYLFFSHLNQYNGSNPFHFIFLLCIWLIPLVRDTNQKSGVQVHASSCWRNCL